MAAAPLANGEAKIYTSVVVGFPEFLFIIVFGLIVLAGTGFWIWMLIECVTREPDRGNTKVAWTLIIVCTHFVGALIYYLVRRDHRLAEVGH